MSRNPQPAPDSGERLQQALTAGRIAIWEWNAFDDTLTADRIYRAFFGLAPQNEAQPAALYRAQVIEQDIGAPMALARAALESGREFESEQRVIQPGGGVLWMFSRGRALPDEPERMIGVSFDITQLKQTEAVLRQSEARLQAAVDLVGLGLYAWDPQTNALTWDARVKAMWGFPPETPVKYDMWRERVHPGDLAGVETAIAACTDPRGDGVYDVEYRVNGADGVERWVATRGRTIFQNEQPSAFYGVALDITARKHAEEAMRDSEERFRQFAEYSADVLWILNTETRRLDYLSPAYESVWGRPREAPPVHWTETIHADDREGALAALARPLSGELVAREYRIVRPDGRVRWIRDTLFPMRDAQGRVHRIGGIAEDATIDDGSLVYIVDDDAASREGRVLLLQRAGHSVKAFASGAEFLEVAPVLASGCVVVDIASLTSGGLTIARQLRATGSRLPVIAVGRSGGDVSLAVQAMKAGAVDWLEVPYAPDALLAAVASALATIHEAAEAHRQGETARRLIAEMSTRERQVLDGLLAGGTNKSIGKELGISPRTVELHRAGVMERLGARTLPEAVLMAATAGIRLPARARPARRSR
jgi:PAS domain S-box-containing protein